MNRKKVVPSLYFIALIMATFFFVAGILLGNTLSSIKLDNIQDLRNDIRLEALGTELQYLVLDQSPCEYMNMSSYSKELTEIGKKLTFMEKELGQDHSEVLSVKEHYHLLQIQHWVYTKKWLDQCSQNKTLVMFFYSNLESCATCDNQGYVLSYLWENSKQFNIYSFEYAIKNPVLNTIKELYDIKVEELPVLIVNDKKYTGFLERERLIELLGLEDETE